MQSVRTKTKERVLQYNTDLFILKHQIQMENLNLNLKSKMEQNITLLNFRIRYVISNVRNS